VSLSNLKKSLVAIKSLSRAISAMRILSMSSHTVIKREIENLKNSLNCLNDLENQINFEKLNIKEDANLLVFIGSSKGLCGNYNNEIKKNFLEIINKINLDKNLIILIGSKLISILKNQINENFILIHKFEKKEIENITDLILKKSENYSLINFNYLHSETLFKRKFISKKINYNFDYDFKNLKKGHFSKESIINSFKKIYIKYNTNYILYNALLSEQGSRFISMDSAYRNSKKIIAEKELFYNKKRQSIITNNSLEINSNFFL